MIPHKFTVLLADRWIEYASDVMEFIHFRGVETPESHFVQFSYFGLRKVGLHTYQGTHPVGEGNQPKREELAFNFIPTDIVKRRQ